MKSNDGTKLWLLCGLRGAALAGVAALLVACGGDSDCNSPPAFEGEPVGSCAEEPTATTSIARLSIVLTDDNGAPTASLSNNGTDRLTATVTALDSSNAVVPGGTVTFSVTNAEVAPSGSQTDELGKITASVGIGSDRSNRSVTITARASGGPSASATFLVTGAKLTSTTPPVAAPGAQITASYSLADDGGNPMVGESIRLSGNGISVGEATTDVNGMASFQLSAPNATGAYTLTATAVGVELQNTIQVQSSSVPAAVGTVIATSVAANPSVVSVNSQGTNFATTVRALFKAADNAPVKNVRVWFTLPDPNSVGGSIGDEGIVYSDATGTASTTYVPGAVSSPTNGVTVLACYSNVDFTVPATSGVCPAIASDGSPVRQATATLTVVDQALRISIGTNELINVEDSLTYRKDFVVVVVDAAGNAKAGVEITPKLDLTAFYKGYYEWNGDAWVRDGIDGVLRLPKCLNEDLNRNGVAEQGEDVNGNGELDPAGVSITMFGSSKTDASGKAIVRIEYPRDRATWIDYIITVTGRVGGSEGLVVYEGALGGRGPLPAVGSAFTTESPPPAFVVSPYGRMPSCDNTN